LVVVGNDMCMLVLEMVGCVLIELKGCELGYDLFGCDDLFVGVLGCVV